MKRNDIGDSFVFGCSSESLRRGECIYQEDDHAALCWKHAAQPSRDSPVDAQKGYVGTPTIRNALSLLFPFPRRRHGRRVSMASTRSRRPSCCFSYVMAWKRRL